MGGEGYKVEVLKSYSAVGGHGVVCLDLCLLGLCLLQSRNYMQMNIHEIALRVGYHKTLMHEAAVHEIAFWIH